LNSLGWRHTIDLVDGLERTVNWYVQSNRNDIG
jgi:dTDP-D-glucose 4,6-dehydratase